MEVPGLCGISHGALEEREVVDGDQGVRVGIAEGGTSNCQSLLEERLLPSDGRPRSSVASRQASPANRPQSAPLACGSAAAPSGRGEGAANARSPVALLAGIDSATTGTGGEAKGPAGHALEQSMAQVWGLGFRVRVCV